MGFCNPCQLQEEDPKMKNREPHKTASFVESSYLRQVSQVAMGNERSAWRKRFFRCRFFEDTVVAQAIAVDVSVATS